MFPGIYLPPVSDYGILKNFRLDLKECFLFTQNPIPYTLCSPCDSFPSTCHAWKHMVFPDKSASFSTRTALKMCHLQSICFPGRPQRRRKWKWNFSYDLKLYFFHININPNPLLTNPNSTLFVLKCVTNFFLIMTLTPTLTLSLTPNPDNDILIYQPYQHSLTIIHRVQSNTVCCFSSQWI